MLKSLSQIDQRFALRTTTTTISSSTCHKSTFDLSPSSVERGKYPKRRKKRRKQRAGEEILERTVRKSYVLLTSYSSYTML